MIRVILKPKRDKSVRQYHPWIFSGALDRLDSEYKAGDLVRVFSSEEEFLGIGYLNPKSQIAVRMLSFKDETINTAFFVKRLEHAKRLRLNHLPPNTNAYRLVHSEGDFVPGLIVDRYADYVVAQFLTAGIDALKPHVVEAIDKVFEPKGIFERDEGRARRLEGLENIAQTVSGKEPPSRVVIEECGRKFFVDLKQGAFEDG